MQEFNPLVSIIIYSNEKNYIDSLLDSCIKQTYKNKEIILLSSYDIEINNSNIKHFNVGNKNKAQAFNFALNIANGEYISFITDGYILKENKIETNIKELSKLDDKSTIIYSNIENIDNISIQFEFRENVNILQHNIFPILFGMVNLATILIHKSLLLNYGSFNEKLEIAYDYDLLYRILKNNKIKFISDILVSYKYQNIEIYKYDDEVYNLWIEMLNNITENDLKIIGLSQYGLYEYLKRSLTYNCEYNYFVDKDHSKYYSKLLKYLEEILINEKKEVENIDNIKVSIVIPFYNRIEYTLESIESIKKQTHSNWELILINDSSTEDISEINKLCDGKKIKLYNNTYGKGVSTARNFGMDIADGDYLIFLDSDDIFIETKIEKSIKYMLLMGADFSATSYTKFFENSTRENISLSTNKYHIEKNIELSPSFVTLSKKIYQNKEYRFNKEFENGEDVFLFMKISKDYILFHLPEYLTLFRILTTTTCMSPDRGLMSFLNIYIYYIFNIDSFRMKSPYYIYYINIIADLAIRMRHGNTNISNNTNVSKTKNTIIFGFTSDDKYFSIILFGIKLTFKKRK